MISREKYISPRNEILPQVNEIHVSMVHSLDHLIIKTASLQYKERLCARTLALFLQVRRFGLSASPRPSVRVFLFVGVYLSPCVGGQRSASDVVPKYLPTFFFFLGKISY